MKGKYDLIVVGGGASGLVGAISFKNSHKDKSVLVVERLSRVGKKILVTGNGRCNLTNLNASKNDYNDPEFVSFALSKYPPKKNIEFFEKIGVLTTADEQGRVYPYSFASSSILNALRNECERLRIEFLLDTKIEKAEKKDGFVLNDTLRCDRLLIASGGRSSSVHGSDGSGYGLLESLGHTIVTPEPSLVQICTEAKTVKQLKGIRVRGRLTLESNGAVLGQSEGEILFTDYGISGIASLDLSSFIAKKKNKNLSVIIDMAKEFSEKDLFFFISQMIKNSPHRKCFDALSFILPQKASEVLVKITGIEQTREFCTLKESEIKALVKILKSFSLKVTGIKGFDMSQVTSGGVLTKEFDNKTMESKIVKGLYASGEIFDVDSRCGGFNLQWAWSSGRLAGLCTEEEL